MPLILFIFLWVLSFRCVPGVQPPEGRPPAARWARPWLGTGCWMARFCEKSMLIFGRILFIGILFRFLIDAMCFDRSPPSHGFTHRFVSFIFYQTSDAPRRVLGPAHAPSGVSPTAVSPRAPYVSPYAGGSPLKGNGIRGGYGHGLERGRRVGKSLFCCSDVVEDPDIRSVNPPIYKQSPIYQQPL